ncbi:hypothetical protein K466DRAFT_264760 [Polyporus arcularius HHB13444]|uniref:Uncharacterized protein n=1 Tax=Polyporus arcularius HHB13444 TaxID=1314778 RepID=A0A5C3P2Z3_9APHY|nr:hypothetical protein K466DRAFT_264760 [Polyporus arcularius HHB13444]
MVSIWSSDPWISWIPWRGSQIAGITSRRNQTGPSRWPSLLWSGASSLACELCRSTEGVPIPILAHHLVESCLALSRAPAERLPVICTVPRRRLSLPLVRVIALQGSIALRTQVSDGLQNFSRGRYDMPCLRDSRMAAFVNMLTERSHPHIRRCLPAYLEVQ